MGVSTTQAGAATPSAKPMTPDEKKIILASSLGTIFEWYDFYLYGSLAVVIAGNFFGQFDETEVRCLLTAWCTCKALRN